MPDKEGKQPERKLAGFFKQIQILFWKNGKLFLRNKLGTFGELIMAFIFILMLLIIRYFVDSQAVAAKTDTTNPLLPVLASFRPTRGKNVVLYYPNNDFIRGLVNATMADLTVVNATFRPSSKQPVFWLFQTHFYNLLLPPSLRLGHKQWPEPEPDHHSNPVLPNRLSGYLYHQPARQGRVHSLHKRARQYPVQGRPAVQPAHLLLVYGRPGSHLQQ
jgi:hypothetical protein